MKGCVYFILNSDFKKTAEGGAGDARRDDPDIDLNSLLYVYVEKFGLEWVNDDSEKQLKHHNLTSLDWDHSALGVKPSVPCGACLRCDIRSRDFSSDQCVVIVVSSHGVEDNEPLVFMSDRKIVRLSEIVNALSDSECPLLAGKTRIIVVQSCRSHFDEPGTGRDKGQPVHVLGSPGRGADRKGSTSETSIPCIRPSRKVVVEPPVDFLIVFSSPSGMTALRGVKETASYMFFDTKLALAAQLKPSPQVLQVNFLETLTLANNLLCQRDNRLPKLDKYGKYVKDAAGKEVMCEEKYKVTMCIYHRLTNQPVFNIMP